MPPFEIPFAPTLWAAIMWDYVNLPVDDVPMRTGIAPCSIDFTGPAGRKTSIKKWQHVLTLPFGISVEKVNCAMQVDSVTAAELRFQIAEQCFHAIHH
jgi:hypothetical protein